MGLFTVRKSVATAVGFWILGCGAAQVVSTLLSDKALAISTVTITGSIPRDTSRGYFDLTITVRDVLPSDVALKPKETNLTQRLGLLLPDVSSSDTLTTDPAGTATVAFYLEHRGEVVSEQNSNGNYNLTFYPRVRQINRDGLANLVSTSSDRKSVKVRVKYFEDTVQRGDPTDATVAVNPTVANEAPTNLSVLSSHRLLSVTFDMKSSIGFVGTDNTASSSSPMEATIIAFRLDASIPSLPAKIFTPSANADPDSTCEFNAAEANGGNCIVCGDTKAYLDADALALVDPVNIKVRSTSSGVRDITGVENGVAYAVVAMYQPDGIQRSACLTATPTQDYTFTELNGEGEATEQKLACFIATAAYGTPLHRNLRGLRWFRDGVANVHPAGNALIEAYYRYSPPLAAWIAQHPTAAAAVRAALWTPAMLTGFAMSVSREAGLTPAESIAGLGTITLVTLVIACLTALASVLRHRKRNRGTGHA